MELLRFIRFEARCREQGCDQHLAHLKKECFILIGENAKDEHANSGRLARQVLSKVIVDFCSHSRLFIVSR